MRILLGLYLGDGMLSIGRGNVWKLRISLDAKYPQIVARAQRSRARRCPNVVSAPSHDPVVVEVWRLLEALDLPVPPARTGPQARALDHVFKVGSGASSLLARVTSSPA